MRLMLLWILAAAISAVEVPVGEYVFDFDKTKMAINAELADEMLNEMGATRGKYWEMMGMVMGEMRGSTVVLSKEGFSYGKAAERIAFTCSFKELDGVLVSDNVADPADVLMDDELENLGISLGGNEVAVRGLDFPVVVFVRGKKAAPSKATEPANP
ncbi:MAG: hypothetical protein PF961_19820 [Planctomycetota bacterium]|nr:hypothetical protein [Planctomycetota bacterium]